jgi:TPR repeat protein
MNSRASSSAPRACSRSAFASARPLLERAADAPGKPAALMLATTYDPQVIGNQDMRSITADPAMARQWYQKAAALGSADARRRLSELRN